MLDHKIKRYLSAMKLRAQNDGSPSETTAAEKEYADAAAALISDIPEHLNDAFGWMAVVASAATEFMPELPVDDAKPSRQQRNMPIDQHLIWIATWVEVSDGIVYRVEDPFDCMSKLPTLIDRIDYELNEIEGTEEEVGQILRILLHFRLIYLRDLTTALTLPEREDEYDGWDADELKDYLIARAKFFEEHGDQYSLLDEAA